MFGKLGLAIAPDDSELFFGRYSSQADLWPMRMDTE